MKRLKSIAKWAGIALVVLFLLAAIVPLLIPVAPLENLASAASVAPPESQFVTLPFDGTDGIDIHYLADEAAEDGEPTFVLLHGSNFNAFTWNETLDFFGERGRVVAYDQIPYGLSEKLVAGDWNGRNPYSTEAAIAQLMTLLDTLGVEKAILVGNSYGSVLALEAALAYPDRVEALILADSAVYVSESMPPAVMNLPQVQRLGPLFGRMIGGSEAFVRQTYLDPTAIDDQRMRLTLIHTEVANWDVAMWDYLREWGTAPIDIGAQLTAISQPALVLTGDGDAVAPPADSERLANALPNADYTVLANCGHVPQEECPTQFTDAVDAWLGQFDP
jgi:pimeloyl-ACP methyl ester carboxylesterase